MQTRKTVFVNEHIYHIYNRTLDYLPVFDAKRNPQRFLEAICFYQFQQTPAKLAHFLKTGLKKREKIFDKLVKTSLKKVEILAYCIMTNHFHLLLKQVENEGISSFCSLIQNSFTRYYNTKNKRCGPIFQGPFKAVLVENDNQLIHLSRYIHLNPYSAFLVKTIDETVSYPWSSLGEYLQPKQNKKCQSKIVMSLFDNDPEKYRSFVKNQADYQRQLQSIKHLALGEI